MWKKRNFQFLLLFAIEMVVLSVLLQKEGLGTLGVKVKLHLLLFARDLGQI